MPRHSDAYDIEIGHRVRANRLTRRMSQSDLGGRLGVTYQQIQKYETGCNRIGAGRLRRIAEIFGTSLPALFGPADGGGQGGANDPLALLTTDGAIDLLEAYARIKDRNIQRALVRLARTIGEARQGRRQ